jgi:hypothetical protein
MDGNAIARILSWADTTESEIREIGTRADAAHVVGMHDARVEIMCENAFNGFGDETGSDEYGVSVAWLDLSDHIEYADSDVPEGVTYENVGAYLATHPHVEGFRYVLAYWQDNGSRSVMGFATREEMRATLDSFTADFNAWEESES